VTDSVVCSVGMIWFHCRGCPSPGSRGCEHNPRQTENINIRTVRIGILADSEGRSESLISLCVPSTTSAWELSISLLVWGFVP
jgi:hypothetical protein